MQTTFKLEGLADLEKAMMEMAAPVAKRIGVRALINAAQPMVDHASEMAPVLSGHLEISIAASTRLSRRQAAQNVKTSDVEVYVGPDNAPQAVQSEFGNENHAAQPFMRPAFDANQNDVMFNVRDELAAEISKRAEREARKQARLLAKAQGGR